MSSLKTGIAQLAGQVRQSWRAVAAAIVFAGVVVVAAAAASILLDVPIDSLMVDPLSRLGVHPLIGAVSNLGILIWATSAGACAVAFRALRPGSGRGVDELRWFFLASACLTILLTLDDTFQIHEDLVPRVLGRGQTLMLAGYVLLIGAWVWRFRRPIAASEWIILALAGAAFAFSIAVDLLPVVLETLGLGPGLGREQAAVELLEHVLEDGAKLVGIVLWTTYFIRTAAAAAGRPPSVAPGDRAQPGGDAA